MSKDELILLIRYDEDVQRAIWEAIDAKKAYDECWM